MREGIRFSEPVAGARLRQAADDDVKAVVDLVNSAYRGEEAKKGWTTEADLLDGQRVDAENVGELIASPDTLVILAEDAASDDLLACCELRGDHGGDAYFGMFSVSPLAQGRGLGRAVLTEAERQAVREWSARRMTMLVIRQREALIAWYERCGYALTGKSAPFPYGDERFGIPLRDDLEFVELAKEL
ncbi:GNAT family N-acetyltransferase [Nocardiopsis sp. RSe5-2]|uniref:GNAT family N-acetyltransferase n=1 Tax=Nocardiopsis endophytica TaxID=3018445 RepID=A0ABT4U028_9ACTN|nr:GNAT family N-acetyltransferase [Nocardiopsis endophytica]MDA2809825.1 GNAT family N-acetyltransferase [Nocardiopsis endophytica]